MPDAGFFQGISAGVQRCPGRVNIIDQTDGMVRFGPIRPERIPDIPGALCHPQHSLRTGRLDPAQKGGIDRHM